MLTEVQDRQADALIRSLLAVFGLSIESGQLILNFNESTWKNFNTTGHYTRYSAKKAKDLDKAENTSA